MQPIVNTADLIDAQDVASILGLAHRNSVTSYLHRYPDMPRPAVDIPKSKIRLWFKPDIVDWARRTGRWERKRRRVRAGRR